MKHKMTRNLSKAIANELWLHNFTTYCSEPYTKWDIWLSEDRENQVVFDCDGYYHQERYKDSKTALANVIYYFFNCN